VYKTKLKYFLIQNLFAFNEIIKMQIIYSYERSKDFSKIKLENKDKFIFYQGLLYIYQHNNFLIERMRLIEPVTVFYINSQMFTQYRSERKTK